MSYRHRTGLGLGVAAILAIGIALRMGPLYTSPLPFNPDGIVYAGLVRRTMTSGTFPLTEMAVDAVGFTAFLTVVSEVTGSPARFIAQPTLAFVGTLPALVGLIVARRLAHRRNWSETTVTRAALLTGVLLAVEGLFLHRSMAVDEQTIGLFLVPLALLALVLTRMDRRWRWAALPIVAVLPIVHNLDTVLLILGLAILVGLRVGAGTDRTLTQSLLTVAAVTAYAVLITLGLAELTSLEIIQSGRLTAVPGLFIAWIVAIAGLLALLRGRSVRTQRVTVAGLFGLFFCLILLNAVRSLFPGLPRTPPRLFVGIAPLFILAGLAAWDWPRTSLDRALGPAVLAMVGGPLVLIGLSLTARLTPEYLNTAYRASTFLHVPVLAVAGVGLTSLLRGQRMRSKPIVSGAVVAVVIIAAASSIPIAFAGLELLPYKGVTTPAELSAAGFAATHSSGPWAADDHISRITRYWSPNRDFLTDRQASVTPVRTWLATGGSAPPPRCLTVAQESWTTTGAQMFPQSPLKLPRDTYNQWIEISNVVYASSGTDPIVMIRPRTGGRSC